MIKIPIIDLGKLSRRNHKRLINLNNYPSPLTYSPNYDCINP